MFKKAVLLFLLFLFFSFTFAQEQKINFFLKNQAEIEKAILAGDWQSLFTLCDNNVKEFPNDPYINLFLGFEFIFSHEMNMARDKLQKINTKDIYAWFNKFYAVNRSNSNANIIYGILKRGEKMDEIALGYFKKAADLEKNNPFAIYLYATTIYSIDENRDEFRKKLEEIVKLAPDTSVGITARKRLSEE